MLIFSSSSKQPASVVCFSSNPVLELNFGAVLCGLFVLGSLREAVSVVILGNCMVDGGIFPLQQHVRVLL